MTIEARERKLRQDARRVLLLAIKGRMPIAGNYRGWMLISRENQTVAYGADPFPYCLSLEEAESFVRTYAQDIGAMSNEGSWLVDKDGEPIDA